MRILHVSPSYLPAVRYGGPVLAVHGLCRALVQAGHRVDVFTTSVDGDADLSVPLGAATALDGVGVHYFPVQSPRRWCHSPALAAALESATANYDLVHVHALFLHPVSAATSASHRAGVPYLVSPRGMLVREMFRRRSRWLKSIWLSAIGRDALERAAAVHVTSAHEAQDVQRFGLRLHRVLEVPNGVDAAEHPDAPRDPQMILFLGRLSWKKGLDRLLRAVALLPSTRLVVAGNDDEGLRPQLEALAVSLRIDRRVTFVGAVAGEGKRALYARAGVFVLASHSENFANTVLEAMAAGCPVVLTAQVGLADTVRQARCGLVCGPAPRDIAQAVAQVLEDRAQAARMGTAGQARVREGFLWPQVAARMSCAYRALVARGAAAA